jgi:hypothetical protein
MGTGERNYLALILVGVGVGLLVVPLLIFGFDLSTIPFYFSVGSALIVSGIIFVFVRFHADRRYCASCMLSFALFAFIIALVFTITFSPSDFLRFGMGWMYALIFFIVGTLFWFFEPRGSGGGWVGLDCSGCESCGHVFLFFIVLFSCGVAYILETAGTDPLGLALVAMLIVGALLHLARLRRK